MISSVHHPFTFFISFITLPLITATQFSVLHEDIIRFDPDSTEQSQPFRYIPLGNTLDQVFGLSSDGIANASLSFSVNTTAKCPASLSLCQVSAAFVRGPNYQRRQTRRSLGSLINNFLAGACQSSETVSEEQINNPRISDNGLAWCISRDLCSSTTRYLFSVQDDGLQPNEMYLIGAALCLRNVSKAQYFNVSINGSVEFRNPDLFFPQLGFEEALFPVFSATIMALLGVTFLLLTIALVFAWRYGMPIRKTVRFVIGAMCLKLLSAILTFVHFYTLAQTGNRQGWYLYVRLLLASSADILFIISFISISSAYAVMPSSWFVEDRSPVFLVYIGVVLQLLIVIAVKIMFPFQYLGAATYTIAGSAIALIACVSSYRNARFLQRFGHLIERSHIFLKSTPICQLRSFYIRNIGIVAVAYIIKIISVVIFDYRLYRPDLLWGTMEIVDAVLLTWFAIFVFPRQKSALYVDMSNLSNERLHQAERWRARRRGRQTSNETGASISSGDLPITTPEGRNEVSTTTAPSNNESSAQSPAQQSTASTHLTRRAQGRLRQDNVERGHVRFAEQPTTASNGSDTRRESVDNDLDPQPPWIAWTSGECLPRPNSYTWRGRHRGGRIVRREGRATPFLHAPIVVGSPEGSFDIIKLTVGMPVTGTNAILRAFDEKGAEVTELPSPRNLEGQLSTAVNGRDDQHAPGTSRLDAGVRFSLPTRRQNRVDERHEEAAQRKRPQVQRGAVQETIGSLSQISETVEAPGTGQITRTLSSSTTGTACDGIVSNFGAG